MSTDNSGMSSKVNLRSEWIKSIGLDSSPYVLECFAGYGEMFKRCYVSCEGVALEKDKAKSEANSVLRPSWIVYRCDSYKAIAAGYWPSRHVDVLDIDAYADPLPIVESVRRKLETKSQTLIFITDGNLQSMQRRSRPTNLFIKRESSASCEFYKKNYARLMAELLGRNARVEKSEVRQHGNFMIYAAFLVRGVGNS